MESDDQLYHTSGRLYNYPVQPPTYYDLTSLDPSLPTRYPESSQRSVIHSSSYATIYNQSSFRAQNYDLRQSGGQFDSNRFYDTSLNQVSPHALYPFPDFSAQSDQGPSVLQADFYGHLPPSAGDLEHSYVPDASFMRQPSASNEHFTFTGAPNNAFAQVSAPSAGSTAGPAACDQIPRYIGNLMPSPPFDRKRMYTGNTSAAKASDLTVPGSLTKSAAVLNIPLPSHHLPNLPSSSSARPNASLPEDPVPLPVAVTKKKKSKMHDCEICGKKFPRPSGLKTHMNIHNNVRPYPCTFPGCTRKFAVRSNAKRHLRTHGIIPAPTAPSPSLGSSAAPYIVGFNPPTIVQPPESETRKTGRVPFILKWMPPSLSARSNASRLRPISDVEESDIDEEDDEYDELLVPRASSMEEENLNFRTEQGENSIKRELNRSGRLALSIPLRPVVPTSPPLPLPTSRCAPLNLSNPLCGGANSECYARYEERNSFREAGSHPYHPSQFRILPGPAVLRPSLVI